MQVERQIERGTYGKIGKTVARKDRVLGLQPWRLVMVSIAFLS